MTKLAPPYRSALLVPNAQDAALALLRQTLGGEGDAQRSPAFWRWKHEQNPFGTSYVLCAYDDEDTLVSLRTLMRWRLEGPGGTSVRAARPVDTATHPAHRRRGVFTALTHEAVEAMHEEGTALLFNTPNANSLPGDLKMGWREVARWPLYARPCGLRFVRALLGLPREPRTRQLEPWADFVARCADQVEQVVAEHEAHRTWVGLRTPRSAAYLDWRYGGPPGLHYAVLAEETAKHLTGFVVGRETEGFRGLRAFLIADVFCREGSAAACAKLFRRAAAQSGADYLVAHFAQGSVEQKGLRRAGFFRMPGREHVFVARALDADLRLDPSRADAWDLALSDLEVF